MKRISAYVRSMILSPEFVVLLIGLVVLRFGLEQVRPLVGGLNLSSELLKWLALAPIALTALIFQMTRAILLPNSDHKADLHDWERYWELKVICSVACFYGVLFGCFGIGIWAYKSDSAVQVVLFITALTGAGSDFLSVRAAEIAVNEHLAQRNKVPAKR